MYVSTCNTSVIKLPTLILRIQTALNKDLIDGRQRQQIIMLDIESWRFPEREDWEGGYNQFPIFHTCYLALARIWIRLALVGLGSNNCLRLIHNKNIF